jgi:hypothetical protein
MKGPGFLSSMMGVLAGLGATPAFSAPPRMQTNYRPSKNPTNALKIRKAAQKARNRKAAK